MGESMTVQKKRKAPKPGRLLHIVILIISVLIIFEGRMLISIFSREGFQERFNAQLSELFPSEEETTAETETEAAPVTEVSSETDTQISSEAATEAPQTEPPLESPAIVPEQAVPVDDSYFSDATFIGDSRMEGFRINSGITEGTFLTGVGMDTTNIFQTPFISSPSGNILVFQALYGTDCEKFYVLLGTNELGTYDWNEFKENYRIVLGELKKLSPNALIYVMSVPYVEEDKVTTGDYINNENVDTMNRVILELCEENGYHFLNINEVLSNGNHSLIEGATSDGVHMYPQYCEIWLNYLKNHYVPQDQEGEET